MGVRATFTLVRSARGSFTPDEIAKESGRLTPQSPITSDFSHVHLDAAFAVATPRTDRAGRLVGRTVLVSIPWGSETPEDQGGSAGQEDRQPRPEGGG